MFVEIVRLLIVLLATAAGYELGKDAGATGHPVVGATLGASLGYVAGGVFGRQLRRAMGTLERRADRAPAAQLLVGGLGGCAAGAVMALLGLPAVTVLPGVWGWPVMVLLAWIGGWAGFRVTSAKTAEVAELLGLRVQPLTAAALGGGGSSVPAASMLVDSSAAIDGRLAVLVEQRFVRGPLLVPRFVLDELQGIADSPDLSRRRRGRRGLELLQSIRDRGLAEVLILEQEVPEVEAVDAKLVALAERLGVDLVTCDRALARVSELRGVRCLNPQRLSRSLAPEYLPGETVRLPISREGKEPGQGVGYLDDGSMVVVGDAAGEIGHELDVVLTSSVQTSVGRLYFASRAGVE